MRGTGTIVNVLAVLAGGSLGLCLKKGLKERYQEIVMQALGLCTIFIGISGALKEMFTIENGVISTSGTMLAIFPWWPDRWWVSGRTWSTGWRPLGNG